MLLRKSRAEEDDPDALSKHRAILCDLAAKDGVEIAHVCEELMSGERLSRRPQFQALLALIRALPDACVSTGSAGAVLYVMDVDRISRGSLSERGLIQDLFINKAVRIRTPGGWVDLSVADELLLTEVRGALAHHYLNKFRERVAHTRRLHVRQGRVRNGSVPFGYEWDRRQKVPIPHPVEFPVLQAIINDAFHMSLRRLVEKYGVPRTKLYRALTSPTICGWPARTVDYRPGTRTLRYLPREEWVWPDSPGDYPAAISREEWERLQSVLSRRNKERAKTGSPDGWCKDRLRFAGHEGRVRLGSAKSHREGSVPTYELSTATSPRPFIARSLVHQEAKGFVRRTLAAPRLLDLLIAAERGTSEAAAGPDWTAEVAKAKRKLEWVMEQRAEAQAEQQEALVAVERKVVADLRQAREMAARSLAIAPDTGDMRELIELWPQMIQGAEFDELWERVGDEGRRLLVNTLAAEITVTRRKEGKAYAVTIAVVGQGWLTG